MNGPELEPFDFSLELLAEEALSGPPAEAKERVLAGVLGTVGVAAPIAMGSAAAAKVVAATATAQGTAAVIAPAAATGGLFAGAMLSKGALLAALIGVGGTAVVVTQSLAPKSKAPVVAKIAPQQRPVRRNTRTTKVEPQTIAPKTKISAPEPAIESPEPAEVAQVPAPVAQPKPLASKPTLRSKLLAKKTPKKKAKPRVVASPAAAPEASRRAPRQDVALEREQAILKVARRALARGNTQAALTALRKHARQFRKGRLVEERTYLHIRVLARAGRWSDARAAAARFKTRFPRSLLRRAVDAAVSTTK